MPDISRLFPDIDSWPDGKLIAAHRFMQAERAKHDLYYLTTEILGYADLGAMHRPLARLIESANTRLDRLPALVTPDRAELIDAIDSSKAASSTDSLRGVPRGVGEGKTPTKNPTTFSEPSNNSTNTLSENAEKSLLDSIPQSYRRFVVWQTAAQTRLWLMFRGSFKTTIISIAHTIQLMLRYPNIRILIASHKKDGGSAEILGAIKRHFTGNEKFRALFPEYCPKPNQMGLIEWGTSEKVTLPNRSSNAVFPEATIEIAGHTTDVTGRHYDYIKADDLVTKDSVTNETMIQKTRQYFSLLKFLFNQPEWGIIDVVGTPYHFADLYATLKKSKGISSWSVPVEVDGELTFPERFTKEGIGRIKHEGGMSSYEFSCQYMLNPVPTEDQSFRPEYFEHEGFFFDEAPNNLRKYVLVDPASKRRKESDYTALITIGVDDRDNWWLLDIIRDKLSPDERARLAISTALKHGLKKVHYETIGFQDTDAYNIKRISAEMGTYISVEEIKAAKQSKEDRIRGLQPKYEARKVHWPRKYTYFSKYEQKSFDMVELLMDEMLMFPKCEHDDMIDCHSFILRTATYAAPTRDEKPEEDKLDYLMRKLVFEKQEKPKNYTAKKQSGGQLPYKDALW